MRKYLLLILSFVFQFHVSYATNYTYRYWIDQNTAQTRTSTSNELDFTIDISNLSCNMHTLFIQVQKDNGTWSNPIARPFLITNKYNTVKTCYWFDDNVDERFTFDKVNGEAFMIDASNLSAGIHSLNVMLYSEEDILSIYTHTFVKMPELPNETEVLLTFWIDGVEYSQQKVAYSEDLVLFDFDVETLASGTHKLEVQASTASGLLSDIASAYFVRMPNSKNDSVLAYRYWVNDNNADSPFTAVDDPTIPYTLIGDLDVAPQPLRCARFHFEVNNDMPMLYAENDIHVQFMAADGHLIKTTNAYVESVAADTLTAEEWTEIQNDTVIYADKPTGETIYWYAMNLEAGDTVCLKTNYSSTLQVFSHSGNQVLESKADSSLIFRQFIAEKAEMYYVALHTVNTTKAQVTLTVDLKKLIHYYQVETSVVGNGTVTEGGTYAEGTVVTLTATPDEGYQFTQWSDGNTDNPRTLVLTQDTSLVAYFEIIYLQPDTVTLCYGETYQWHDKTYDASGVYIDTLSSGVATLYLTILPQVEETIEEATICSGDTYTWQADGKEYAESGTYSVTLQDINGCDSVVILHLTVNPIATAEEHVTACDSYTWNGETYTQSGEYVYTTVAANGCDSIVTLHLTINNSEIGETEYVTICYGETYTWNGQTYSTEGEYSITLSNTLGCDSVATLHLTIMPEAVTTTETVVIGSDELPYTWRGNTYSATGQYTVVEQYTTVACDSAIHKLDLTVLTTGNHDEQSVTICETETPYTWYGESYSATGKYTYTEKYVDTDIDSIQHILNLTVNPTVYTEEHITACDSYEWNGQTYTESGEYVYTTVAANGCDSIVTLHLTINQSEHVEFSMTACDSYEWHGMTYTISGDYTYTTTTEQGCERVEVLHLTINKSEYIEESVTACDSYEWHGMTYTISGDYIYNTTTDQGCERVEVLHLTINKSEYVEESVTACDSYEWHGMTYTISGDYTYTTTTDQGCERVEVLHLTINKSEYIEESVTACDSYEWHGMTYTVSGDYTYTTTTDQGCERVEVLHLTILPDATTESEELALCPSELPYEWHGQWLTEAGSYTASEQYAGMDCDSIIHELTVNVYVQTLPVVVTLPIVRTGEAIDVTIPTAEIQVHIAAETWYAPNAEVAWYIMENSDWAALTTEPVATGTTQVVLKYAVATDCGNIESDNMVIDVIPTSVENTHTQSPTIDCQKILHEDHIYILRDGKIYSIMGQEM